jgi:integrase
LPDFDATLWALIFLRGQSLASATIEQALRSIIVLYLIFRNRKIKLTERLRTGCLLDAADCEAIANALKRKIVAGAMEDLDCEENVSKVGNKVVPLEKFRAAMIVRDKNLDVGPMTTVIRMGYIRSFIKWRVNREIFHATGERKADLIALRDLVDVELKDKTPSVEGLSTLASRSGIDRKSQVLLLDIVTPTNTNNPWADEFSRIRNHFIVNAYLYLGVRRGELLGVRVNDIKPRTQEVMILRRPDDVDDPRLSEPNTKTRDRVLPLSAELYELVKTYLKLRHNVVRGAHEFLVVADSGEPLSKSAMNRLFCTLNEVSNLSKVSPHILRHTYCENLADDLYRAGKGDAEILGYLRRLGGWSDHSNSPRRYTKRFAQERANEASLSMQKKLSIKASREGLSE